MDHAFDRITDLLEHSIIGRCPRGAALVAYLLEQHNWTEPSIEALIVDDRDFLLVWVTFQTTPGMPKTTIRGRRWGTLDRAIIETLRIIKLAFREGLIDQEDADEIWRQFRRKVRYWTGEPVRLPRCVERPVR